MKKAIDYKQIDVTKEEYDFYKELVKVFTDDKIDGRDYFRDLFEVDSNGMITLIKTDKAVPWSVLFFVQQLMLSQRMRINDKMIEENKKLMVKLKNLLKGK